MRMTTLLCFIILSCSRPPVPEVFSGQRDHGDKPGVGLELRFVGDSVVGGIFSVIVPLVMGEIEGVDRADYPIQVISQDVAKFTFSVDFMVGSEMKPFLYDAWLAAQPDGTINAHVDKAGGDTPREQLGPPIVLKRARS